MTKVEETLDHMRHDAHCLREEAKKLRARAEEFELNACALDGAVVRISAAIREDTKGEEEDAVLHGEAAREEVRKP
jgi:hypothetical protein